MDRSSYVLGIDLGTTTSVASIFNNGSSKLIKIDGLDYIPSVVSYKEDKVLVGIEAKSRMIISPNNTISSIKRHMGEEGYTVKTDYNEYSPEEITAEILKKIVYSAENSGIDTKKNNLNAVICIPANFNDNAKKATLRAAKLANINVLYLLEEPVAAAIMYGDKCKKEENILVYDLGGGTFDVCVLNVRSSNNGGEYKILSKEGISYFGGDDFDFELMRIINSKIKEIYGINLLNSEESSGITILKRKEALQKLKEASENSKIELSEKESTNVLINNIINMEDGQVINIDIWISREEFNKAIEDLIDDSKKTVLNAIKNAKLNIDEIDKVILVGGSSLIPRIKEKVTEIFNKEPYCDFNPRTIVAEGAGIYGAMLSSSSDNSESYDKSLDANIKINQIVTHNLGIMISGMRFSKLISKGDKIPKKGVLKVEKEYYTQYDNQTELNIYVYQCDEDVKFINEKNNEGKDKAMCIGEFKLMNIRRNKKGHEKIYVTFSINEENIVSIKATSITSGSEVRGYIDVRRV